VDADAHTNHRENDTTRRTRKYVPRLVILDSWKKNSKKV